MKAEYLYVVEKSKEEADNKSPNYSGDVIKITGFPPKEVEVLVGSPEILDKMKLTFHSESYAFDENNYSVRKIPAGTASYIRANRDVSGESWREILINLTKTPISRLEGAV